MEWWVNWGDKLPVVREAAEANGVENSPLAYKPKLREHLQWYWTAWQRLSQSRGSDGFGPTPIPLSEIYQYCQIQGITATEEVCRVIDYIQALDSKFIEMQFDDPEELDDGS